ncbi:hypothetical protein ACFQ9X_52765 [Catenulispora yoronensis]
MDGTVVDGAAAEELGSLLLAGAEAAGDFGVTTSVALLPGPRPESDCRRRS